MLPASEVDEAVLSAAYGDSLEVCANLRRPVVAYGSSARIAAPRVSRS